jgi:hypothetical protein
MKKNVNILGFISITFFLVVAGGCPAGGKEHEPEGIIDESLLGGWQQIHVGNGGYDLSTSSTLTLKDDKTFVYTVIFKNVALRYPYTNAYYSYMYKGNFNMSNDKTVVYFWNIECLRETRCDKVNNGEVVERNIIYPEIDSDGWSGSETFKSEKKDYYYQIKENGKKVALNEVAPSSDGKKAFGIWTGDHLKIE